MKRIAVLFLLATCHAALATILGCSACDKDKAGREGAGVYERGGKYERSDEMNSSQDQDQPSESRTFTTPDGEKLVPMYKVPKLDKPAQPPQGQEPPPEQGQPAHPDGQTAQGQVQPREQQ